MKPKTLNPLVYSGEHIYRMDLDPIAGSRAYEHFIDAAKRFENEIDDTPIDFDAGYQLQDGECFQIKEFVVPDEIISACRQPLSVERLSKDKLKELPISGIIGFDISGDLERIFFQNFDSRKILTPGQRFSLSLSDESTFHELDRPVILLDSHLCAIWEKGTLRFRSFHLVKQIFDLTNFFVEATKEQLEGFASHISFKCENKSALVAVCNQWSRKKIALILKGGILDDHDAKSLLKAAKNVDYSLNMDEGRIVLPYEKDKLKELLQFLDEDIYRGPISHHRLLSSGHRSIEKSK